MRFNLIVCICLLAFMQVSAKLIAQRMTIQVSDISMEEVFKTIKQQTGYVVVHNSKELKHIRVSLSFKDAPVETILESCLAGLPFSYRILAHNILIKEEHVEQSGSRPAVRQQREVSGKVTSENGEPLEGVTVRVKNSAIETMTNVNGDYRIAVPLGEATLVFSMLGYLEEERKISSPSSVDVVLMAGVSDLDEVVVVGFGQQKRATVTGALPSLGTKELMQSPQANISNMLVGRLPGLLAVQRSGQPGADQSTLRIRGVGTFSGSQAPLVLVDGIEGINFNNLDPNEIENISILKDASATAVYGVRGANGVILITTKKGEIGKPKITFSSNFASTSFTDMRESARAYDYVRGFNEALKYDS